jgi:PilZ domain
MDRREHHRVQLRIPARLRWTTPLGQTTEICETLNVSRGGLLVPCKENHASGTSLWITFPYDATLPFGQPEVLAHVVRCELVAMRVGAAHGDAAATEAPNVGVDTERAFDHLTTPGEMVFAAFAAMQLEVKARPHNSKNGNVHGHGNNHCNRNGDHREVERRTSIRRKVAVLIRVRLEHVPWFEETMTIDVSNEGLRFVSCREYEPSQYLAVSFVDAGLSAWPMAAEFRSLVLRVDPLLQGASLAVTIYRLQ